MVERVMICVVGGAGFLGRRIVRKLAALGHEVVSLDINPVQFPEFGKQVRSVRIDVTVFEDVIGAFQTFKPEAVVNLSYMLGDYLPRPALKLNVFGMDNCFEAARLCDVERVVFASSIAVNGDQKAYGIRNIVETDPVTPGKQYAWHKVFNEWQAKDYSAKHGMRITGIRAGNVAGTDKVLGSVDHVQCIVNPALGLKVELPYRDRMRSVIHGDDAAEVFVELALCKQPRHDIYNTGGETFSLGQIADMVKELIPEAEFHFASEVGGVDASGGYMFDNARVESEFGIQLRPYRERIPDMIESVRRRGAHIAA
jgi:nucleoside-diphosphate-sugar epimerase